MSIAECAFARFCRACLAVFGTRPTEFTQSDNFGVVSRVLVPIYPSGPHVARPFYCRFSSVSRLAAWCQRRIRSLVSFKSHPSTTCKDFFLQIKFFSLFFACSLELAGLQAAFHVDGRVRWFLGAGFPSCGGRPLGLSDVRPVCLMTASSSSPAGKADN